MTMTTRAAVLWERGEPWTIEDVELDEPRANDVLVRMHAAGMCHSDDHAKTGDMPMPLPVIGGHEGAGVVEAVGPDVQRPRRRRSRRRLVRARLRHLPLVLDRPPVPLRQRRQVVRHGHDERRP